MKEHRHECSRYRNPASPMAMIAGCVRIFRMAKSSSVTASSAIAAGRINAGAPMSVLGYQKVIAGQGATWIVLRHPFRH
jgi:hypothetical protein